MGTGCNSSLETCPPPQEKAFPFLGTPPNKLPPHSLFTRSQETIQLSCHISLTGQTPSQLPSPCGPQLLAIPLHLMVSPLTFLFPPGWPGVFLSMLSFLFFTDMGIYWIHRGLHHKLFYKV